MYRPISNKLENAFVQHGLVCFGPKSGWEMYTNIYEDLVSIPYEVHIKGPQFSLNKVLYAIHPLFNMLTKIQRFGASEYINYRIFDFNLSTMSGTTSIEELVPVEALIHDENVDRFYDATLRFTIKSLLSWCRDRFETRLLYIESTISCFPDVVLDMGFKLRDLAPYHQSRSKWRATRKYKDADSPTIAISNPLVWDI